MIRKFVALAIVATVLCQPIITAVAQPPRSALSPEDEKRRDELMRNAKTGEMVGYIAAGVAVAAIVIGVPIAIYFDRKKKAGKNGKQLE